MVVGQLIPVVVVYVEPATVMYILCYILETYEIDGATGKILP